MSFAARHLEKAHKEQNLSTYVRTDVTCARWKPTEHRNAAAATVEQLVASMFFQTGTYLALP